MKSDPLSTRMKPPPLSSLTSEIATPAFDNRVRQLVTLKVHNYDLAEILHLLDRCLTILDFHKV